MHSQKYEKLSRSFYLQPDVVEIAQQLLGKVLVSTLGGNMTAGRIVETEAYDGRRDKACHAFLKRTRRNQVMYQKGGIAYIYLCYGIHHLFNIVTNEEGLADAVLIRAVEPLEGMEIMQQRRNKPLKQATSGPGKLSEAMGIITDFTGTDLTSDLIWIGYEQNLATFEVEIDRRVGVDYAEEDALLPWRFFIKGNPWVSKQKQKDVIN
jgi:DNA-3-methyladenine glycosylase